MLYNSNFISSSRKIKKKQERTFCIMGQQVNFRCKEIEKLSFSYTCIFMGAKYEAVKYVYELENKNEKSFVLEIELKCFFRE
jgi:hypothetical protein